MPLRDAIKHENCPQPVKDSGAPNLFGLFSEQCEANVASIAPNPDASQVRTLACPSAGRHGELVEPSGRRPGAGVLVCRATAPPPYYVNQSFPDAVIRGGRTALNRGRVIAAHLYGLPAVYV